MWRFILFDHASFVLAFQFPPNAQAVKQILLRFGSGGVLRLNLRSMAHQDCRKDSCKLVIKHEDA